MADARARPTGDSAQGRESGGNSSSARSYPLSTNTNPRNALRDEYGLKVLSPGEDPVVDIIAVHGFNGHWEYTWTAENNILWLRDLLPEEVPKARILSFGYDTENRQVFDVGESLVSEISLERRKNKIDKERPILFIAHSLGGIIVKSALIYAESTRSGHLLHHKHIKLSTYGILFFGTPHQGGESLLADIDSAFSRTNKSVREDLMKHSAWIQQQLSQYLPISGDFNTIFFYETLPTITSSGRSILMVPKPSAVVPGAVDVESVDIGRDHITMVKYSSAQEHVFKKVSEHISLMLEGAPKKISENWRQLETPVDPERAKILQWLSTVEYRKHHLDAREGRLQGTGGWLLGKDEFCEWQQSKKSSILWLHGIPGAGKTKLTSMVVDKLLEKNPRDSEAIAYFYCKRDATGPSDPEVVMRTIVKQLSCLRAGPLPDPVLRDYEARKKDDFSSGLLRFGESLDLIKLLTSTCMYTQTTIVIDALDECDESGRVKFLCALTEIMNTSTKPVKIFVSSRDDGDIVLRLEKLPNLYIEAKDNIGDIQQFARSEVTRCVEQKLLLRGKVSNDLVEEVIFSLIDGSHGMFLWVDLQIKELCAMMVEQDVRTRLGKFPRTLEKIYSEIYQRILSERESGPNLARNALMWVMCSCRPLQPDELTAIISRASELSEATYNLDIDTLFHLCYNLLVLDRQTNVVQFAHLSVREFLEQYCVDTTGNIHHPFNVCDINSMAAEFCLSILVSRDTQKLISDFLATGTTRPGRDGGLSMRGRNNGPTGGSRGRSSDFRIAKYAIRYWVAHVRLCSDQIVKLVNPLNIFFGSLCAPSAAFLKWFEAANAIYKCSYFKSDMFRVAMADRRLSLPILIASEFGFGEKVVGMLEFGTLDACNRRDVLELAIEKGYDLVVRALVKNGVLVDKEDGDYLSGWGNALGEAASRGHEKLVKLLLELGANVNIRSGRYAYILQELVGTGRKDMAELLLQNGADVNAQGGKFGTALQAAIATSRKEMVELVLQNGADVNAQGGKFGTALQAAIATSRKEMVELMLQNGADVHAQGGAYSNPLQAAIATGRKEIVELLFQQGADVNAQGGRYGNALHAAISTSRDDMVELQLQTETTVNTQTGAYGNLLQAPVTGRKTVVTSRKTVVTSRVIVELLLQNGADVNAHCGPHKNALEAAVSARDLPTINILRKHGAALSVFSAFNPRNKLSSGDLKWYRERERQRIIQHTLAIKISLGPRIWMFMEVGVTRRKYL